MLLILYAWFVCVKGAEGLRILRGYEQTVITLLLSLFMIRNFNCNSYNSTLTLPVVVEDGGMKGMRYKMSKRKVEGDLMNMRVII